jgi:hypothetical protein
MSQIAAWIYVEGVEYEPAKAIVDRYLVKWAKRIPAPRPGESEPMFFKDGARRILILPAVKNWTAVLEADESRADLGLVRLMAQAFSTRVIWATVRGDFMTWQTAVYEGGEVTHERHEPAECFEVPPHQLSSNRMPEYGDAGLTCYRFLREQGVPLEIAQLTFKDVHGHRPRQSGDAVGSYYRVSLDGKVKSGAFVPRLPERKTDEPPPVPHDRVELGLDGETAKLVADVIRPWGEPDEERIAGLVDMLEARARRIFPHSRPLYLVLLPELLPGGTDAGPIHRMMVEEINRRRERGVELRFEVSSV